MPTISTLPSDIPFQAGKGVGQAEREARAFQEGIQRAQVANQRKQLAMQQEQLRKAQKAQEEERVSLARKKNRLTAINKALGGLNIYTNPFDREKAAPLEREKASLQKLLGLGGSGGGGHARISAPRPQMTQQPQKEQEAKTGGWKPQTFEEAVKFEQAKKTGKQLSFEKTVSGVEHGLFPKSTLTKQFPLHREEIEEHQFKFTQKGKEAQPLKKDPIKKSWLSWHKYKRDMAGASTEVQNDVNDTIVQDIKNQGDLMEFVARPRDFAKMGASVAILQDYYKKEIQALRREGYITE